LTISIKKFLNNKNVQKYLLKVRTKWAAGALISMFLLGTSGVIVLAEEDSTDNQKTEEVKSSEKDQASSSSSNDEKEKSENQDKQNNKQNENKDENKKR